MHDTTTVHPVLSHDEACVVRLRTRLFLHCFMAGISKQPGASWPAEVHLPAALSRS